MTKDTEGTPMEESGGAAVCICIDGGGNTYAVATAVEGAIIIMHLLPEPKDRAEEFRLLVPSHASRQISHVHLLRYSY